MITELGIGNFKAFGETQRVPIKPLTLIFGANSSGKSSIIHGLLLARHIWQGGEPDAQTLRGLAESVDLGGFQQFVFNQDRDREVGLSLRFSLPRNASWVFKCAAPDGHLRVEIGLAMRRTEAPEEPLVAARASILNGNIELARLEPLAGGKVRIVACRELIARLDRRLGQTIQVLRDIPNQVMTTDDIDQMIRFIEGFVMSDGVLPQSGHLIPRIPEEELVRRESLGDEEYEKTFTPERLAVWHDMRFFFSKLSKQFSEPLVYLGPLRYHPPRRLAEPQVQDPAWRSGGGAAWWQLQQDEGARTRANALLRKLALGYELDVHRWNDSGRPSRELRELILKDSHGRILSARDVGVGVSQALPLLLLASTEQEALMAVEQPELHLHPALQAELGDLFIESALGQRKSTFILETHSEHLILRILRRVRETTEGTLAEGCTPIRPEQVSVVYVQPGPKGAEVLELPVTPDGDFGRPWPGGFFAERLQDLP